MRIGAVARVLEGDRDIDEAVAEHPERLGRLGLDVGGAQGSTARVRCLSCGVLPGAHRVFSFSKRVLEGTYEGGVVTSSSSSAPTTGRTRSSRASSHPQASPARRLTAHGAEPRDHVSETDSQLTANADTLGGNCSV